jgi:hypothetical protein
LGDGQDAHIYYDGTDLIIDPDLVGSGTVSIGGNVTMPEDGWIGIGAALERVVFDGSGGFLAFTATDISLETTRKIQFRDPQLYIASLTDGSIDIVADTNVRITGSAVTTLRITGVQNPSMTLITTSGTATMRNWQWVSNQNTAGGFSLRRSTTNIGNPVTTIFRYDSSGNALLVGAQKYQFRDAAIYIASLNDGYLDFDADSGFRFKTSAVSIRAGSANVQNITLFDANYGIGMDGGDIVMWGNAGQGISFKDNANSGYNGNLLMRVLGSGSVGIGTSSAPHGGIGAAKLAIDGTNASTAGPHMQFTTASDNYPLLQVLPWTHDGISLAFDAYFTGAAWTSSDAGSNFLMQKSGDLLIFRAEAGIAAGAAVSWVTAFQIESDAEVMFSPSAALKTYWRDAAISLSSQNDGYLDFEADLGFRFGTSSVEVDADEAYYFGPVATNGSWRIIRSGNDLVIERREAGAYVTKSTISA